MTKIGVDKPGTLLTMTFSGRVTPEETARNETKIISALTKIKPGFRLLTDLSALELMDPACLPYLAKVMDLCSEKGISEVIRVIPDVHKDIGFNILSLFHYHHGVRFVTCSSLEEAAEIISGTR
ncbi:MAG TPA: hypothetical protein VFD66_04980 [Verrucomicrobiae bacterium]|nr:hypothetical protein [Verrucomicrobiae bacterium]